MLKYLFVFGTLAAISFTPPAEAKSIGFGDNSIHFPNWESSNTAMNGRDVNGIPNILNGEIIYADGYLQYITINYLNRSRIASVLKPGDLFLDAGSDRTWDYVVDLGDAGDVRSTILNPGNYDLLDFSSLPIALGSSGYGSTPADNPGYILTQDANRRDGTPWGRLGIRPDHPYALTEAKKSTGANIGSVGFDGWKDPLSSGGSGGWQAFSSTFDFTQFNSGLGFYLGNEHDWTLGFAMNCANDLIYESLNLPMPEPTSWMLMGTGLLGLIGQVFRRKRRDGAN